LERERAEGFRTSPWPGGRVPETIRQMETRTGKVRVWAIPKHLRGQARAKRKRRGPRRRRRI